MRVTYACGERVGHLVVDVDLVHDCPREVAVLLGHDEDAGRVAGGSRPLDHHRDPGRLEPAAQDLRLQLRPLAELDERIVVAHRPPRRGVAVTRAACRSTSATRQSAHCTLPARYSAPHDGHHTVGLSPSTLGSTPRPLPTVAPIRLAVDVRNCT